jgi:hypothetical protein
VYAGDYNSVDKVDRSQGVIAFGEQQGTTAVTQTVSVYNGGNTPLTISGVAVSGTAFATATATSGACVVNQAIAPGSLCQIAVSFTSPHAGIFSGTLTIASNSLNNSSTTQTVALSAFTYGVYVTESPNPLNFGNQTVGTTSAPQTITFTNNGDLYSAGIGNPTFSGSGYTVTLGTCFSIAVGSSCTGTVTFSPTAVQSYNGVTATFQAGSSGGGPNQVFTLTLNGAGTAAAAPAVTLLPTSVAFPNQPVGTTSAASTVQLTNSGTAALTITGISITGTNPTAFAETSACGTTLAAGSSCNISVTFTPSSAGAFSASLSVADNAAGSPQTVPLTGNGAPAAVAQLQFNPSQINAIAGTGTISNTATGDGGPALQATFTQPYASAQDQSGNYYVSDYGSNYVRKFTVNGNITAYAGIDGYSSSGFSGDGGLAINAKMNGVEGLAVDAAGNLYIADNVNGRVRKVTASTGIITTFAGSGQGAYVNGAAALSAKLPGPTGLAFDPAGNLYIACGAIVVKVTPAGATSLFAGTGTVGYNGDNILATTAEL